MSLPKEFLKGVKSQLDILDKEIAVLQSHRSSLSTLLAGSSTAPKQKRTKADKSAPEAAVVANGSAPVTTTAPSGSGHKKGYIGVLLPFMSVRTEVAAAAMHDHLKAHGNPDLKRNSLDAAIQNELKKGDKARIARVRPGVYKITEVGVDALAGEQRGPQPVADAAHPQGQPQAQAQPAEVEEAQPVGF